MSVDLARGSILPAATRTLEPPKLKRAPPEPGVRAVKRDALTYAAPKRLLDLVISTTAIVVAAASSERAAWVPSPW